MMIRLDLIALYWRPLRGTIPPHVMDSDAASPDA
jgi:hypothetical protein